MFDWYAPLRRIRSKGSITSAVGGLSGLAAARAQHQGQFWTPDDLVRLCWRLVGLHENNGRLTIFDNSYGSGRMFQFANPSLHRLVGIEIDQVVAAQVQLVTGEAGFDRQLEVGSMDAFRADRDAFDVALINPSFSVHLDTPFVEDRGVNSFGRYGSYSATLTHRYALAQALAWCRNVVAVVPRSMALEISARTSWVHRHKATLHLPRNIFRTEGAQAVDVAVLVFGPPHTSKGATIEKLRTLDHEPVLDMSNSRWWSSAAKACLRRAEDKSGVPAVTHPVTGDKRVRVSHDGRKVILKFGCAITQARTLNHVLREPVEHDSKLRRPPRVKFIGQGAFDIENFLAQPAPFTAFEDFLSGIDALGFETDCDPAIWSFLMKRTRRRALECEPFRLVANVNDHGFSHWLGDQTEVKGTATSNVCVYRDAWQGCPITVEPGTSVKFTASGENDADGEPLWRCKVEQRLLLISQSKMIENFDFPAFQPKANTWTTIHQGLAAAFPERYHAVRSRARKLGLHKWCSWRYQFEDLCEISMKRGAVVAWEMGLGKARLAISLCYLSGGKHNLISVEANLIEEMKKEFRLLRIPASDWQVIVDPEQALRLRRINVIAYSKLKSPLKSGRRVTYADRLRRRVHTHVADEGHLLRNPQTQQTRAVVKVSAKGRRYLLSGTPIANYPRDILPLLWWVSFGDGTCSQIFGQHWPLMQETNLARVDYAPRGIDRFREMVVVTEWITNEFADGLQTGAKREVPRIADVKGFRRVVAPWVKRRVQAEPEVSRYVKIPTPRYYTHKVPWDLDHLELYVKTVKEFVDWYTELAEWRRHGSNLVAVLAKIRAVFDACNYPQAGAMGTSYRGVATSKQRKALELLLQWQEEGHKSIVLCDGPRMVEWLARNLEKRNIEAVRFHGKIPIAKRLRALDSRFREGPAGILVASKHSLQQGLNIHQACRVLHYDRAWTPKIEQQVNARVLRPQQEQNVKIHYLGLPGSIDDYQAQMVVAKAKAMRAGLDFGHEDEADFLHLETLLGRFVEDFEKRRGPLFKGNKRCGSTSVRNTSRSKARVVTPGPLGSWK